MLRSKFWLGVIGGALLILFPSSGRAQSIHDCKTIFVRPMPDSLDRFVSTELVKWGAIKVVADEAKADCYASFGRSTTIEVKSSGSIVVPTETTATIETPSESLPSSFSGTALETRNAALEVVHRESSVILWADSKSDFWSWGGGTRVVARKLVDQLRKDYKTAE